MRQRLHYIDVAKGMLILMVIATHIDGMTSDDGLSTDNLWTIGGGYSLLLGLLLYASVLCSQRFHV